MRRAMTVKLVAGLLVLLFACVLPPRPAAIGIAATLVSTIVFLAWVIVSPRSQFFVRSVCHLPARAGDRAIAFTFDDGPDPVTTPRVLDLLSEHGARATFFVVGERAARHPDLVRRIVAEGHAIGSHTYHHSHAFHFLSPARMREEVRRGVDAIAAVTGAPPTLFRPPQGLRTPLLARALDSLDDLVCVTWTERGLDTFGRAASAIVRRLEPEVRPSAILTLHDGGGLGGTTDRSPTVEAVASLLDIAAARRLRCVSLAALESSRARE
jgi:peptidoglycan-N-acetylglucosamine deacetylase